MTLATQGSMLNIATLYWGENLQNLLSLMGTSIIFHNYSSFTRTDTTIANYSMIVADNLSIHDLM